MPRKAQTPDIIDAPTRAADAAKLTPEEQQADAAIIATQNALAAALVCA